jgi:cyclopropane fatty-acyl-phospholipid synthase-like methyltransferase
MGRSAARPPWAGTPSRTSSSSPYDAVPYLGHPFAQTHPDRLATLATLFGLEPPPVERCRVLELGCGDGGNLIPMALGLPGAQLVGIDASASAIERGRQLVDALRLSNVALEALPIEDFEAPPGGFDYVIAHGVYSWVSDRVRDRLLALCREGLSEQGVAYVSYNALPGGRLREAMRDMLVFHSAALEPRERVAQARAFLGLLIEGWSERHEFGVIMRRQAERLLERSDETLFHDELAGVNESFYFHQFAEHAARHGLQYLAEADFFEMQIGVLHEPTATKLLAVEDPLLREQYLDFLKGRMFRQTLLCRDELELDRTPRSVRLDQMAASSPAKRGREAHADGRTSFEGPSGSTLTTDHPVVSVALERLGRAWPAALWVRDLAPVGASEADRDALRDALLRSYAANLIQLHVHPPQLAGSPGELPEASPLARHQARSGGLVTNLRHTSVRIDDELGRRLVSLLDGSRDRATLNTELSAWLRAAGEEVPRDLGDGLERSLRGLARLGVLRR